MRNVLTVFALLLVAAFLPAHAEGQQIIATYSTGGVVSLAIYPAGAAQVTCGCDVNSQSCPSYLMPSIIADLPIFMATYADWWAMNDSTIWEAGYVWWFF